MVARRKRTVKRITVKRDDLQWRVSNSLLILVFGLMFLGYGIAEYDAQTATGLLTIGGLPDMGGGTVILTPDPEWKYFKHDLIRSGQASGDGPDSAAAAWIFDTGTGKPIEGSPVTCGGKVIFGSADGHIYAVNNNTGQLLWKYPNQTVGVGAIYGSPACPGDTRVYFGSDDNKMRALKESDGTAIWTFQAGDKIKGSPIVDGGVVYFGSLDKKVYALKSDTGAQKWVTDTSYAIESGPALSGTDLFIANNGYLGRLSTAGGSIADKDLISIGGIPKPIIYMTTPAVDNTNKKVYAGEANGLQAGDTAKLTTKWKYMGVGAVRSGPIFSTDAMYVFFGSDNGKLYAVQTGAGGLQAGGLVWDFDTSVPVMTSIALSNSTPAPGDKIDIVFTAQYAGIESVSIGGNNFDKRSPMQWNYTLSTAGVPDGTYDMSITVVHDLETWFRRPLKMTVNSTAWKVTFDDLSDKTFMLTTPVRSTPAVDSKRIYLAAENGTVYALNMDGSVAWSYFTGNLIRGSPAIARGRVYIGTQNGKLFSLSSILTADQTAPTYSNQRQSGDNVGVGGTLTLSVDAADDTALGSATLATDETGAWVKYTNKYGSSAALAGKSATASFTWSNSNIGEGKTVKWKVYIKDASGKETVTAEKSFKVVGDIEPPAATSVGQRGNTVVLGSSNELYAYWTDNSGLVKAELLIGGTKVDEVALEGKSGWSNFTYTPTTTGTVSWQIRAMDGSGNTGLSGAKNFETLLTAEDKTAPTAETPSVSATSVTAGEAVNIKVRAADNVGLKKAELEVNGRIVDSFDFAGAPTGEASFAYAPPAGGSYQMRVVLTDSAGNTISTSTFTVTAQAAPAITCTGIAPQPSVWTTCKIEGGAEKGTQSRIIYECDATTGIYRARTETRDCEAGFQPLPTVYIAVGLVLIVMAGASLLLWKRRMPKKEAAPATAPAPAETTQ